MKKEEENLLYNRCPPRNRPWSTGSKVGHANYLATRSDRAPRKLTVHIGHTIRVPTIFVFACTV